jgi:hypothetical protein
MRVRLFTALTAVAVAGAVVTPFGTAAVARPGTGPALAHRAAAHSAAHPDSTLAKLWNQNKADAGVAIVSQDFEAALDGYDSQAADDFKVPAGTTWKVKEVDTTSFYFDGAGPADSVDVTFYTDAGGLPGAVKKAYSGIAYVDPSGGLGSFAIFLPKPVKLTSGTYWVSVVANMEYFTGGEWAWETRATAKGHNAAWQNPGDAFGSGCVTWSDMPTCAGPAGEGPDFMFALVGSAT